MGAYRRIQETIGFVGLDTFRTIFDTFFTFFAFLSILFFLLFSLYFFTFFTYNQTCSYFFDFLVDHFSLCIEVV